MKGKRGKDNELRKVGMYLVKELCDLKLQEIAEGSIRRSCQQKI
jgi:chromosomal replication initiation ATPase DnaA